MRSSRYAATRLLPRLVFGDVSRHQATVHHGSKHVASLEKEVGAQLFVRGDEQFELTPVGRQFYHDASVIACKYFQLLENVERVKKGHHEEYRIGGVLITRAYDYVAEARKLIRERDPNARFSISSYSEPRSLQVPFDALRDGVFDIIIEPLSSLVKKERLHGLAHMHLYREPTVVVVEQGHPLAEKERVSIFHLEDEVMATLHSNYFFGTRKHFQSLCLNNSFSGIMASRKAASFEELFLEGLGEDILVIPESMLHHLGERLLEGHTVPRFDDAGTDADMCVFYRENPEAKTMTLIQALQEAKARIEQVG